MTVATEISEARFTAIVDGVPLNCPFPCTSRNDVVVRYGSDTVATLDTDYSVTLSVDFEDFTVTPLAGFAALSDGTISVAREVSYLQTFDLLSRTEIGASSLESALDYLTFMSQQLATKFGRVLTFPYTDADSSLGPMPVTADRIGKYFSWDADGKPTAVEVVTAGALSVSAFGTAWVALADAASGLTTLGFTTVGALGKKVVAAATIGAAQTEMHVPSIDGSNDFTGALNRFTQNIIVEGTLSIEEPTVDAHAATKGYVDDEIAAIVPGGPVVNQSVVGPTVQNVTATGTYTTPANCKWLKAKVRGSGGGGGSVGAAGSTGSNTSFNAIVAAGGSGGAANDITGLGAAGGAGGTGGAGAASMRRPGSRGGSGSPSNGTSAMGGSGGGAGGAGSPSGAGTAAAANSGGGGGGAGDAAANGGGGGGGEGEYFELIIINPAATYAVVIGAGGTSGSGAGGSGFVSVEEHYNY